MVTDQIADLLTRIRNAHSARHPTVRISYSSSNKRILSVLESEGYIAGIEDSEDARGHKELKVALRYTENGKPVIKELKRLSKPGCRVYVGKDEIPVNRGGLGVVVISTSKGVLSDSKAREEGIGGELICSVF